VQAAGGSFGPVLGGMLGDASPFAGTHPVIATVSFNTGAAVASLAIIAIAFHLLRLAFANVLGPALGVTALSAIIGNVAWSGMTENAGELWRQLARIPAANLWPAFIQVSLWLLPALVASAGAYVALKHIHGERVPTLREALRARDKSDT
jgi:predicted anti-sigma-YlaC factor YlaD